MSDRISFPTTGNLDDDEMIAERFEQHSERMRKNICPNGCGAMTWDDPHNRHCAKCGFAGFSTVPWDMIGGHA